MNLRLLAILALSVVMCGRADAQRRPLEEVAPADTAVFVKIADVSLIKPFLDGSHSIYRDPMVKKILEEVEVSPTKLAEEMQRETGLVLGEILEALEGPAAFCMFPGARGFDDADLLLLAGVKEGEATTTLWQKIRTKVEEKNAGRLAKSEEEDIGGTTVWRLELKRGEDQTEKTWAGISHGTFFVSNKREALEKALIGLQGKEVPTLARREGFAPSMARLGAANDVTVFMDFAPLLAEIKKEMRDKDGKMISALGFDGIRAISFGVGIKPSSIEVASFVHAPAPRVGVLKLLMPEVGAMAPDRFATADVIQAGLIHINFPTIVSEIKAIAEKVKPGSSEEIDGGLAMAEEHLGVNIEKDLLALMTPPIHFVDYPREEGQSAMSSRSLFYLRSPDPKKLAATIATMCGMIPPEIATLEEKEYLGHKITSITINLELPMETPVPAFAASDTHFFLSLGGSGLIERALRGIGKDVKPLAESADYRRAMAGLPEKSWMLAFVRLDEALKTMIDALKQFEQMAPGELPFLEPLFEMDPKTLSKYVEFMGITVAADQAGLVGALRVTFPPKATGEPK